MGRLFKGELNTPQGVGQARTDTSRTEPQFLIQRMGAAVTGRAQVIGGLAERAGDGRFWVSGSTEAQKTGKKGLQARVSCSVSSSVRG